MREPLDTAKLYFELSNKSDFGGIEELFTETTKYASPNTGTYLCRSNIMQMQRAFHSKFVSINWHVSKVEEVEPGVVLIDYDFIGIMPSGEKVVTSGLEYVTIHNGKIQKIEIQSKS